MRCSVYIIFDYTKKTDRLIFEIEQFTFFVEQTNLRSWPIARSKDFFLFSSFASFKTGETLQVKCKLLDVYVECIQSIFAIKQSSLINKFFVLLTIHRNNSHSILQVKQGILDVYLLKIFLFILLV